MYKYSTTSQKRLATAHPKLQELFTRVLEVCDHTILQGHRTREEHEAYLKAGNSTVPYEQSKHSKTPSMAVDVAPYPMPKDWGAQWRDRVKFYEFAAVVRTEAKRLGIQIRWGGDWDGDGDYSDQKFDDLVHFELV